MNILVPLARGARDFASGGGDALFVGQVLQVLMTEADSPRSCGEMPWRTAFGSTLHLLRHRPNDEATRELAKVGVRNALARWLPDARLVSFFVAAVDNVLVLDIEVISPVARRARVTANVPLRGANA